MEDLAVTSVATLCSVVTLIAVIALLGLCACVKSKDRSSVEDADVESAATKSSKKSKKPKRADVELTEVQLREGAGQSNGSVPRQSDNRKSHEDRALPEIPNANGDIMPTDDEEEIDQGHYDVISRHQAKKNNNSVVKAATKATATKSGAKDAKPSKDISKNGKSKPKNHPYEKVKGINGQEVDSDSATYTGANSDPTYAAVSEKSSDYDPMYAGVREDNISDSTYAGVKDSQSDSSLGAAANGMPLNHPYACVDNIGEVEYAQITEKQSKKSKSKKQLHQNVVGFGARSSTDTVESPIPPPVPEKHLDIGEGGASNRTSIQATGSPNLPPRNSGASAFDSANIPYADEVSPTHQPSPSLSQTGAGAAISMDTSISSQHSLEMGGASSAGPVKKEPPYSKVTARESLDEMKKREALLSVQRLPSEADAFNYEAMDYDSINYDQIKSPAGQTQTQRIRQEVLRKTSDRGSFTSDLYAEIGATEEVFRGEGSAGYARVSEVPQGAHAPTPPPVDKLKQLSRPKQGEDLADPGYQRVRDTKRPSSVCSTGGGGIGGSNPNTSLPEQPEYATVDKAMKAKNRKTVHVSGNLSLENLSTRSPQISRAIANGSTAVSSLDQLYAQVSKQDKKNGFENPRKPSQTLYDNQSYFTYQGTGARPKEFAKGSNNNSNSHLGHRKSQSQSSAFVGSSSPRLIRPPEDRKNEYDDRQNVNNGGASFSSNSNSSMNNGSASHLQTMDNMDRVNRNSPIQPSPLQVVEQKDNLPPRQGKVAPGYQTIGGLASLAVGEPMEDPDYDTVEDRIVVVDTNDHDPNYESLPGSATGLVTSARSVSNSSQQQSQQQQQLSVINESSRQSTTTTSQPSNAGVVEEMTPTSSTSTQNPEASTDVHMVHVDTHRSTTPWARREHIYQEIQDAKNENIYTPDPTTHHHLPRRHNDNNKQSQALATLQQEHQDQTSSSAQSGRLPRSASPQYVTNL